MTDKQTDRAVPRAEAGRPTAAEAQAAQRIGVVLESEETRRSKALSEAQAEAVRLQMDETVAGGKYKVGDQFVDANGKPVKD